MAEIQPPATLEEAGRELWKTVLAEYDLGGTSLVILRSMCEAADRAAQCHAQLKQDGPIVPGGSGQPVAHPLLAIEVKARAAMLAHARALKLDLAGGE
ncbi:P27 family phage terminase small subunit [Pseudomonas sp.]|uniref:P27 family phage terminase small subunit n=1 Tax=Pseudomonas sp. TaxID=306 RepID=UPI0027328434|nr:P27 family phage terminase small subunit [Pseudomonas sp.]MDP3816688.1 hypothetical protein [Pseudomonas sp.]